LNAGNRDSGDNKVVNVLPHMNLNDNDHTLMLLKIERFTKSNKIYWLSCVLPHTYLT
jgi:hypothetical protein